MKYLAPGILLTVAVLAIFAAQAQTAPKPSSLQKSWQLEFEFSDLKFVRVDVPGKGPQTFCFLHYKVTNKTGGERIFVPKFVLYTDTGQILDSDKQTTVAAYRYIKTLLNSPFLRDTIGMAGKILQGDDNAKEGVAIWPDFDEKAGIANVFIGGLSGETTQIDLPSPIKVVETSADGKKREVVKKTATLAKTKQLRFSVLGEAAARFTAPIKLLDERWLMR